MRTPANSTKHFMNQLVNAMSTFFNKISKNQIQFQLSDHYTLPKKAENSGKTKNIKKNGKAKQELSPEELKKIKKAYKKFKQQLKTNSKQEQNQDLNEKQFNKKARCEWKKLTDEQQMKWCTPQHQQAQLLKKKKAQSKAALKQNGHVKQDRSKENSKE